MNNLPMELPKCRAHNNYMKLRPSQTSYELKICGVWYDCETGGCTASILFLSKELRKKYEEYETKEQAA